MMSIRGECKQRWNKLDDRHCPVSCRGCYHKCLGGIELPGYFRQLLQKKPCSVHALIFASSEDVGSQIHSNLDDRHDWLTFPNVIERITNKVRTYLTGVGYLQIYRVGQRCAEILFLRLSLHVTDKRSVVFDVMLKRCHPNLGKRTRPVSFRVLQVRLIKTTSMRSTRMTVYLLQSVTEAGHER